MFPHPIAKATPGFRAAYQAFLPISFDLMVVALDRDFPNICSGFKGHQYR